MDIKSEMQNTTNKHYIINSIFFAIVILLILIYFNNLLPRYNEYVYIIISVLFMIVSGLILAQKKNFIIKSVYLALILIPLYLLSYIHLRYKDIINNPNIKLNKYNTLINASTTLFLFQITIILISFENTNLTSVYGSIILSLLNILCSGLIWRVVAFFITNG
jgi:NADH:ubiquinone oxidoreductase subunit 2 (subunit N)